MPENNNQDPLGLPPGTVRAVLAITVTVTLCYVWITKGEAPAQLYQGGMIIWGFYFAQKALATLFNLKKKKE